MAQQNDADGGDGGDNADGALPPTLTLGATVQEAKVNGVHACRFS